MLAAGQRLSAAVPEGVRSERLTDVTSSVEQSWRGTAGDVCVRRCRVGCGQGEGEAEAAAWVVAGVDGVVVAFDDAFADGQAEADARIAGVAVQAATTGALSLLLPMAKSWLQVSVLPIARSVVRPPVAL